MVDLAGSPNDYVDAILAMELVANTLVKATDEDYHRVGLVITRQRSPLYCPPGWPIEEIKHAIRRLQPGDNPKQDRSLRKMVMDVTSNIKHAVVISNFKRPDSIALLKQLPQGCTKIAVKVSSGWDYELEGLHDRTTFDIGDNQLQEVNVAQIKGTYSQIAAIEQSRIREQIGKGQVFPCEVRQDQPDIPGQLGRSAETTGCLRHATETPPVWIADNSCLTGGFSFSLHSGYKSCLTLVFYTYLCYHIVIPVKFNYKNRQCSLKPPFVCHVRPLL